MNLEKTMIIESDNNEKFVIMSVITENGKQYAFSNKLDNDKEPTEEYYIFTIENDDITIIEDNNLINKLLPIFQKEIDNDLKEILNESSKGNKDGF